eukprot:2637355-Amphidinium_carterae.1
MEHNMRYPRPQSGVRTQYESWLTKYADLWHAFTYHVIIRSHFGSSAEMALSKEDEEKLEKLLLEGRG